MRAIDGDALLKRVQQEKIQAQVHGREFSTCFMSPGGTPSTEWWFVEDLIENSPTIEPERKWETCFDCPLAHGCPKIRGCTNEQAEKYASDIPDDCPLSIEPEPCEDAVSKVDVLETYADLYDEFDDYKELQRKLDKVYDKLRDLPSVQPERKTGKWIKTSDDWIDGTCGARYFPYHCDQCGYNTYDDNLSNFCPDCGSYNGGEQE